MLEIKKDTVATMIAKSLNELLIKGVIKKEYIWVSNDMRGIGKTTALINFAKEYDLNVIVPNGMAASHLKNEYAYDKIYSVNDLDWRSLGAGVVFDEGVDPYELKKRDYKVLTGFYNRNNNESK